MPCCPAHALPKCMEAMLEIPNRAECCSATAPFATNHQLEFVPTAMLLSSANLHETISPPREYRIVASTDCWFSLSDKSKSSSKLPVLAENLYPIQAQI